MTTLKITELPAFVQELVQDKLHEVYKPNTALASAIFNLADTRTITNYLPELKDISRLTSRFNNYSNESANYINGNFSMIIDGMRLPVDVEVSREYLKVLKYDIIKSIENLGGQK